MPGPDYITNNPAKSTDHAFRSEFINELRHSIDAILQRKHGCVCADYRFYRARRLRHLPRFHAKDHELDFPNLADLIRRLRRIDHEITVSTVDRQPFCFNRTQVFATRNKDNILPSTRQPPAKISTNSTCAENDDSHS